MFVSAVIFCKKKRLGEERCGEKKGKVLEKSSSAKRQWTLKDEEVFNHQVPVAKAGGTAEVREVR